MLQIIREVGKFVLAGEKKSYEGNFLLKLPNQMEVERV